LLIHIVDISHQNFEEHMQTVHQILTEINASDKHSIIIFNKIDMLQNNPDFDLAELEKTWLTKTTVPTIFISAVNKYNIDKLKDMLYTEVRKIHIKRFPYNDFLYPDLADLDN
jgi:GTP-binding protein HflX